MQNFSERSTPIARPRYKVVKKATRTSAMINGNSKYALKYIKGTEVWALPDTLGIFTFPRETYAENWIDCFEGAWWCPITKLMVIEVMPLKRGKSVKFISADKETESLDNFYDEGEIYGAYKEPPLYTMLYPGVKVIS